MASLGHNISDQGSDTLSSLFGLWPRAVHSTLILVEQKMMLQITNIYQWQICLGQCVMWACSGARYFDRGDAIAVT